MAAGTVVVARSARQFQGVFDVIVAKVTSDTANLIDAAGATLSVTSVLGAALGDFVLVSLSVALQGITVTGYVSAADTVEIRIQNESAGAIDLASCTFRIVVLKPKGDAAI